VREAPPREEFTRVALGQDWGWTNPGVLLVVGEHQSGALWALEEVVAVEKDIDWWAERGAVLSVKHAAGYCYCDPSEPGNIVKMRKAGVRAGAAENAVIPGITAVGSALAECGLFIAPCCTHTIAEMQSYSWKMRRAGGIEEVRPDEPEKVNDHAMDALRYVVMALRQPKQRTTIRRVR
jgi:hypothetical protein